MADTLFLVAAGISLVAIIISFIRLILGPRVADRIVALDGMTIISISLLVYLALFFMRGIYLDVALIYGLISFVGVIAAARFIERGL